MEPIVGIDLGTTNSTLAYATSSTIEQLPIPQMISREMEGEKFSLPSFYFFPLEEGEPCVGWYAKERGAELPDRVISSAKSWLCHDLIDRRSPFLPLGELEQKRSPVDVCTAFLQHLKQALPLRPGTVLVTVPASFDPGARQLVQEATESAGFSEVILMEEPLAAFYAWLSAHEKEWRNLLKVGDTVLVVDCGGGTTDFSLIEVEDLDGELSLKRKAVGDHLLLGGDNIDLALAHLAQSKLGDELDEWQFQSLVHASRNAKEKLLGRTPPESFDLTIQGRGSSVIGGSFQITLKREEVEKLLVDGFFPHVPLNVEIVEEKRSGISKVGLPFARDPRISAQLANFLATSETLPTAVLFNGGTMKAVAFQERILTLLSDWRGEKVRNLPDADLDYAVSRGAVYYGWIRANNGLRVRAGTSRSYFIGVEGAAPAIPGVPPPMKYVRLVPFGMEEGSEVTLEEQRFSLRLEEKAFFRFFSQNNPQDEKLAELHPIEALLESQGEEGTTVMVKLTAKVTELGILELWCVAEDGRKWKLEFGGIRDEQELLAASSDASSPVH